MILKTLYKLPSNNIWIYTKSLFIHPVCTRYTLSDILYLNSFKAKEMPKLHISKYNNDTYKCIYAFYD